MEFRGQKKETGEREELEGLRYVFYFSCLSYRGVLRRVGAVLFFLEGETGDDRPPTRMTDIYIEMSGDSGFPGECREVRRRRIDLRRSVAVPGNVTMSLPESSSSTATRTLKSDCDEESDSLAGAIQLPPLPPLALLPSSSSSSGSGLSTGDLVVADGIPSRPVSVSSTASPQFGFVSLSGRSREMEDAVSLRPCFYSPDGSSSSSLHFFAVFDGHGGSHVSALCKDRMHGYLAEELQLSYSHSSEREITGSVFTAAVMQTFRRMDDLAVASCACGNIGEPLCSCDLGGFSSQIVGSTAAVAVLHRDRIFVANCGDSRVVLSRGGRSIPLSSDHKPDRPDEMARIEAAGGRVIYVNGARVLGILAMSRAIGDKYLKPMVISDPEIRVSERTREDEFLIIASDGIWDVLSNDLACDIARRCLRDERRRQVPADGDISSGSYCSAAATLLTRLALGRKSSDNISVIVVDLRRI